MNNNYKFGFYGKLPFYADFLHFSNNEKLVNQWEKWAQQTLHKSQQIQGKDYWLEQYVKSPVWQFMLTPNVIDKGAYIGVMIPSVDSVGRYYPFMFYIQVVSDDISSLILSDLYSWLSEIQDYILQILELDSYSFDELKESIIEISSRYTQNVDPVESKKSQEDFTAVVFSHSEYHHQQALTQLQFIAMLSCHKQSVWWCERSDDMQASSVVITGMPSARVYLAMLNGEWESYGITSYSINPPAINHDQSEQNDAVLENDITQDSDEVFENDDFDTTLDINNDQTIDIKKRRAAESGQPDEVESKRSNQAHKAYAMTHKGHVREINEDSLLDESNRNLWAVADGMGGHSSGEVASSKLVEALASTPLSNNLETAFDLINKTVIHTNRKLYELSDETIGTTLSLLYICGNRALCIWAGDSRIYLIDNKGTLKQVTKDHCIDGPEGYESNVLTRAVGADETIELDQVVIHIDPGDRLFICSDGVYGELGHGQIAKTLHHGLSAKHACEDIMEQVLKTEARDNLTAVVVDI